jgi:hypothetical protein
MRHVDLGSRLEDQQDPRERAEEGEPGRYVEVQRVADGKTAEELDQRDRQADLDAERRSEEDRSCEYRCYRDVARCPTSVAGEPVG